MRASLLAIFILWAAPLTYSQDFTFEHLTIEDGLPSNQVYFVYRDSKGFMWFCTDRGVSRYNGLKIENFTTDDGLAHNDIFSCFEDKWGRIWFSTFNGDPCFFKNEQFHNATNCSWLKPLTKQTGILSYFQQSLTDSSFYIFYSFGDTCININNSRLQISDFAKKNNVPQKNDRKWCFAKKNSTTFQRINPYTGMTELYSARNGSEEKKCM